MVTLLVCLFTLVCVWGGGMRVEGLTCILCPLCGHSAGLFIYFGGGEGGVGRMKDEGLTCILFPLCGHSAGLFPIWLFD